MQLCVQAVSYSFAVNDRVIRSMSLERGLRWGDPLSPYLFILCAEDLSSLLRNENRRGHLHGYRVSKRASSISHPSIC